jgi:hypothetical protein
MNKKLIIFVTIILLVNIGLSGCFDNEPNNGPSENNNDTKANLIMTSWRYETGWDTIRGDFVKVFMVIINNGSEDALGGIVQIYSTNQNDLLEANKTRFLPVLSPNGTRNVSFLFDYEPETTSLNNKITVKWDSKSREYFKVIKLKN